MTPIHLRNVPPPSETFDHVGFLTLMASWIKPTKYLELGVRCGKNFCSISQFCEKAIGVDVVFHNFPLKENMEFFEGFTDDYFSKLSSDEMFDMVFIDADHSHEQSLKDFLNVKDRVIEDGFIFFHDTYPYDPWMFRPDQCNDCYKTALYIKQNFAAEFEVVTLPFNPGVTIVKKMPINKQLSYA
jgi:predicted O-methyltransferase YrrM